ncbi:MAG: hypothetical protein IJT91_07595 [Clostridia bacterium]|nr:hypothetical protein [Clostridia bacterium]
MSKKGIIAVAIAIPLIFVLCCAAFPWIYWYAVFHSQGTEYIDSVSSGLRRSVRNNYGIYLPDSVSNVSGKDTAAFRDPSFELDFCVPKEDFGSLMDHECWIALTKKHVKLSEKESWNGEVHEFYMNTKISGTYMRCFERDDGLVACDFRHGQYTASGWFSH